MAYIITKEFHFSASHILTGLHKEHPCARLHGHNYVLKAELTSNELDAVGFVLDYRELDFIKIYIDEYLDHRHLNDCFEFNPTAENMAGRLFRIFHGICPRITAIELSETPKTNCRYTPYSVIPND